MYFLSILQATPGQREGKKKRSLGSTCLIMKRNILFLTHFLTIFLPSKKKKVIKITSFWIALCF